MGSMRKSYSANLKASVVLEALKDFKTTEEISSRFGVAPFLISRWKRQAQEHLSELFISSNNNKELQEKDELIKKLPNS